MILVVVTVKIDISTAVDRYETYETIAEARERYATLIQDENTYIANICAIVESTDYDTTQPEELV